MLQSMGSQRVGHDSVTELTDCTRNGDEDQLHIFYYKSHMSFLYKFWNESLDFFFFFGCFSCHAGSSLDQGSNVHLLQWKCTVLTTRLPRKSF